MTQPTEAPLPVATSTSSLHFRRRLAESLRIRSHMASPLAVELYAGCGGLGLGFASAGFRTIGYEFNSDACATYRTNLGHECHEVCIDEGIDFPRPDVLIAGPPCQPFSMTGKKGGGGDVRNGFPAFLSALARARPALAVLENVPPLVSEHRGYFDGLLSRIRDLGYQTSWAILNASDFGVPQIRRRLFVVAHGGGFRFPRRTHVSAPLTVRDALGSMVYRLPKGARVVSAKMEVSIRRYEAACQCRVPRDLKSFRPSRTLTCRNLAGCTGDSVRLALPDGRRRRLTPREAARLQSFPDGFKFTGSMTSQFYQIGNAVPPLMARAVAKAVARCLVSRVRPQRLLDQV